jgi:hypothetical protein
MRPSHILFRFESIALCSKGCQVWCLNLFQHAAGDKPELPEISEEVVQKNEGEPLSIMGAIGPFNLCD